MSNDYHEDDLDPQIPSNNHQIPTTSETINSSTIHSSDSLPKTQSSQYNLESNSNHSLNKNLLNSNFHPFNCFYDHSNLLLQPINQIKLSEEILPYLEFNQFINYLRQSRSSILTLSNHYERLSESYYSSAISMESSLMSEINNSRRTTNSLYHSTLSNSSTSISTNQLLAPLLPLSQHLSQTSIKRCLGMAFFSAE
ncbi:hypothetical protein O181_038343 [Austropuccinia psidii MF-1]|uniref:Uncharacterized protein n=1 Tax=Austropuccinia psidii MF-1 TaxID=1389203 RepID=A0A9Q3DD56_9BASI|nr:hypothetical protein [Austropuccinia psidii MF-1]